MSALSEIMPFDEAIQALAARGVLPTNLDSQALAQLGAGFHRQNFTSARTLLTDLLDQYKSDVEKILNPTTGTNPETGLPRTEGLNVAEARLRAKQLLQSLGYSPAAGERGTIKDLSSDRRIDLVLKTNKELAQGAGFAVQSNDPAVREAFPCWELVRFEDRQRPRDWETRWRIAAAVAGDVDAARALELHGRMVARKDSDLWQQLGDGAGGYADTLGNNFPPFAFGSGMWTQDVSYEDAQSLGFENLDNVESNLPDDLAQLFEEAA